MEALVKLKTKNYFFFVSGFTAPPPPPPFYLPYYNLLSCYFPKFLKRILIKKVIYYFH